MSDRRIIYVAAFTRALATGVACVALAFRFRDLSFSDAASGALLTAGFSGAALAALIATVAGDRLGRRAMLVVLALLSAGGAAVVALCGGVWTVGAAIFVGMINDRSRGAAQILETSILPSTASDAERTKVFAWYNVLQDAGMAIGALAAVVGMFGYAGLMVVAAVLCGFLSRGVEAPARTERVRIAPETRSVLWRLSFLFSLDSFAGGFLVKTILAGYFAKKFDASEATVGVLFAVTGVMNALSHLGAAWLAKRIGLVNTMVFTHIPSSVLLATVPFMPNFWVAALLFVLREGLVEMDVPTRQSYVVAVVRPEERTFASGVTQLVRMGASAAAPGIAGQLMTFMSASAPLWAGAGMKIAYDVMLWIALRRVKPPEEGERERGKEGEREARRS